MDRLLNDEQYVELLQKTFNTESGTLLLKELIKRRSFGMMFTDESMELARREGQRALLRELLNGLAEDVRRQEQVFKTYNPF